MAVEYGANGRPIAGDNLIGQRATWLDAHKQLYLTDPKKAHLNDLREMGGHRFSPSLLLKTVGRKSGKTYLNPLGYRLWADTLVIVASKGGAAEHPAWYLNLLEMKEVTVQIRDEYFRGPWRQFEGAELARVWDYLDVMYPSFQDYRAAAAPREIPVIGIQWQERVDSL